MKRQLVASLCLGISACTPLTSTSEGTLFQSKNDYPAPEFSSIGKMPPPPPMVVNNQTVRATSVTVQNGWLVYAPTEPASVKGLKDYVNDANRSTYYERLAQVLRSRDPITDAKTFMARNGYAFLQPSNEKPLFTPPTDKRNLYGFTPGVGDLQINLPSEIRNKAPDCLAKVNLPDTVCPKSNRLLMQGSDSVNEVIDLGFKRDAGLNDYNYGLIWNGVMASACQEEAIRKQCP